VSSLVASRQLAAELRALRLSKGFTAVRVAKAVSWSDSKISRYETAATSFNRPDVIKLLDFYGVNGEARRRLLRIADEIDEVAWWDIHTGRLTPGYRDYIALEQPAQSIAIWQPAIIPGLLQTREYAQAVIRAWDEIEPTAPAQLNRLVNVRMQRQGILTKSPPVSLTALLTEQALRHSSPNRAVMAGQLRHLAEVAARPSVDIRVMRAVPPRPVYVPAFTILSYDDTGTRDVVTAEQLRDLYLADDEHEVYLHRLTFDRLLTASLNADASSALIERLADQAAPRRH
jgi:transcriptional regulator with XRE-family HTH domain